MVDNTTIRRQLADFKARLIQLDGERTALLDIIKGYEALLRAVAEPDHTSSEPITFPPRPQLVAPAHGSTPVGTVSMRSAVSKVLSDAGEALHSKIIAQRAMALGAATTAKEPVAIVDLILLNLAKKGRVEKTAPRTWRWTEVEPRALKVPEVPTV